MTEAAVDTSVKPKADEGGGGTLIDRVLAKLDSMAARQDAIEASLKKPDAEEDKEKEEEKDDSGHPHKVSDSAKVARAKNADSAAKPKADDDDLTLEHEGKEFTHKPDSKKAKADGQSSITITKKSDADEDKDEEKDKEEEKSDAKTTPAKGKAKPDSKKADEGLGEDDQEKTVAKGDEARADEISNLLARLARLEGRDSMADEDISKFADAQARADDVAQLFGKHAPRWLTGESLGAYERRLATLYRQHSPAWSDVKMSELPDGAFRNAQKQIYADAAVAARAPTDMPNGELRSVMQVDRDTGQRHVDWFGPESFIKGLSRPGRRVAAFRNRFA